MPAAAQTATSLAVLTGCRHAEFRPHRGWFRPVHGSPGGVAGSNGRMCVERSAMPESCRSGGDFRALNRRRPPDGCGGQLSLSAINAQRHGLRYRRFGQVVEADCRLFPFNRNARLAPLGAPGPGAGKAMASGRPRAVFSTPYFRAVFPMTRRDIARPGLEFRRHQAMRRLRRTPESTPLPCARALPPVQGPVAVRPPGAPARGRPPHRTAFSQLAAPNARPSTSRREPAAAAP